MTIMLVVSSFCENTVRNSPILNRRSKPLELSSGGQQGRLSVCQFDSHHFSDSKPPIHITYQLNPDDDSLTSVLVNEANLKDNGGFESLRILYQLLLKIIWTLIFIFQKNGC